MNKIYPKRLTQDRQDVENLLGQEGIRLEENIDATFGKYYNDKLIATASTFKNIIKCVAIDQDYKGGSIFNELMTAVINEIEANGFDGTFVYTKPKYEISFSSIGFKVIERVADDLIFMEKKSHGFESYLTRLEKTKTNDDKVGAIVINANPFTLGHRYLVEYASENSDILHIFVVSEDESMFKTKDRVNMVKLGTADIDNIIYHETCDYLISSATFPSYFIDEDKSVIEIQARLDARIFKYHIAKSIGINHRFVGTELNDITSKIYNDTMREVFEAKPDAGIPKLVEIERKENDGSVISASRVRALINDGDIDSIRELVPASTYDYIKENKLY